MTIQHIAFGTIADIEAEYGLVQMGADWYADTGYTHVVKIIADLDYDVMFHVNRADAREEAYALAAQFDVKVCTI